MESSILNSSLEIKREKFKFQSKYAYLLTFTFYYVDIFFSHNKTKSGMTWKLFFDFLILSKQVIQSGGVQTVAVILS